MYLTAIRKSKTLMQRIKLIKEIKEIKKLIFRKGIKEVIHLLLLFSSTSSFAAPRMPWDDSLLVIQQALTGTTAHIIIIIAIALSGLMWAIGDQGSLVQKAGKVIFGGTIATSAVSICTALKLLGGGA
jgi:type IV secretory pathway VirB2 component (pilin)